MRHPFRRKYLRLRLLPVYAASIVCVALAETSAAGFAAGSVCAGGGLALRAWGAGHLVKNDWLTLSGPYARLRHPLYAGTLLIATGLGLMLGGALGRTLLALFLAVFFFHYFPNKERMESARLERLYGDLYARYRAAVPALVPKLRAWRGESAPERLLDPNWRPHRYLQNDELGTLFAVAFAACAVGLRAVLAL